MASWHNYNSCEHQSPKFGYRNAEIVASAADAMAKLIREAFPNDEIALIFVDGSSATLAVATMLRLLDDNGLSNVYVHSAANLKSEFPPEHAIRPRLPYAKAVFVDDFHCVGSALKACRLWIGRPLDLAIFIDRGETPINTENADRVITLKDEE